MTIDHLTDPVSRRALLRRAGSGASALVAVRVLAACGSDSGSSSSTTTTTTSAGGPLAVSAGTAIPAKTVKFGMAPFGDACFYVIAIRNGWFKDVGISIKPAPNGTDVTPDDVVQKMVTGEADIATFYGPGKIATMGSAPQLKMFGFSDTYLGNYLLAAPDSGATPVSKLVASGTPFAAAIKQAIGKVKGKPVAFTNTGQHRDFLQGIFDLGGVPLTGVKAIATDDAHILALANGGKVSYVSPEGAAQNVELLNEGWFPLVSTDDLLSGLPPGDKLAVAAIGHEGPAASADYIAKESETCLRFLSVMFRTIDAIRSDPARYLPDQIPYLTARSGVKVSVAALKTIFATNDPLVPFEQQTKFWTDLSGTRSYETVYGAQIASAQKDGILPKSKTFTPDDAIVGKKFYDQLTALKKGYDDLADKASGLSGQKAALAASAKTHYANRNYLDAYRLIRAATQSA